MHACTLSCSVTSDSLQPHGTVGHQTLLTVEFSRLEYWSRLPFPTPEDLPNPGTEHKSLVSPALAGGLFTAAPPGKPMMLEP